MSVVIALVSVAGGISNAAPALAASRRWVISPLPDVANGGLVDVSCPSPTSCVAVGWIQDGLDSQGLIEHFDGAVWSVMTEASTAAKAVLLESVSCANATRCVAVGRAFDGVAQTALVETWDGVSWAVTPSATPKNGDGDLFGVDCISASECVAVGWTAHDEQSEAFSEVFDGATWSSVPIPSPADGQTVSLSSVSCPRRDACVAVGYFDTGAANRPLVERWNGRRWKMETPVDPGGDDNGFGDVDCVSPERCVAVGGSESGPLIEILDGAIWSIADAPSRGLYSWFGGVSCPSRGHCVAVGAYGKPTEPNPTARSLIETWNGHDWAIRPGAGPAKRFESLSAVSCASRELCVAVGNGSLKRAGSGAAYALVGRT